MRSLQTSSSQHSLWCDHCLRKAATSHLFEKVVAYTFSCRCRYEFGQQRCLLQSDWHWLVSHGAWNGMLCWRIDHLIHGSESDCRVRWHDETWRSVVECRVGSLLTSQAMQMQEPDLSASIQQPCSVVLACHMLMQCWNKRLVRKFFVEYYS